MSFPVTSVSLLRSGLEITNWDVKWRRKCRLAGETEEKTGG